jgi:hypothetical protein
MGLLSSYGSCVYKCDGSVVSSGNPISFTDITEILLKVTLNTITEPFLLVYSSVSNHIGGVIVYMFVSSVVDRWSNQRL